MRRCQLSRCCQQRAEKRMYLTKGRTGAPPGLSCLPVHRVHGPCPAPRIVRPDEPHELVDQLAGAPTCSLGTGERVDQVNDFGVASILIILGGFTHGSFGCDASDC